MSMIKLKDGWDGNYKLVYSPDGESAAMIYGRQISGSDDMPSDLAILCIQLDDERDRLKKELEAANEALTTAYMVANNADDIDNKTLDKIHMILKEALK